MEEKILTHDNFENNIALKSNKINLGKKIHLPWLIIIIIFIIATSISVIKYVDYSKGQDKAVELSIIAFKTADLYDRISEYENNRKEMVKELYKFYNPNYVSYEFNGQKFTNEDSISAAEDAASALTELMNNSGYDGWAPNYLEHTNIIDFTLNENEITTILYLVDASLIILQLMFLLWYFLNRKFSLTIDDGRIICKFGKKTTKEFMLRDIYIVDFAFLKGLKIKGNSIKYRIDFLSNSEEIKSYIINYIANHKKENTVVTEKDETEQLKKFKDLLDSGVITQEEFEQKKKQLLGL